MNSTEDILNQTFQLKDGRKLGFAEFGNLKGSPVFYFHGYAGGRLEPLILDMLEKEINCRLISLDRPGMGLSDNKPDRTVLDWPDDIIELADHLEIQKFHILGVSGGGPYTAACAYKIPKRIISAGIVAGVAPYEESKKFFINPNKMLFRIIKRLPFLMKLSLKQSTKIMKNKEKLEKYLGKQAKLADKALPKPDAELFKNEKMSSYFSIHFVEIFRQGYLGPFIDGKLQVEPWGFELSEIPKTSKYFLWHGELDKNVPVAIGKYVASEISQCVSKFYPEEAHVSILINQFDEIIETLLNA